MRATELVLYKMPLKFKGVVSGYDVAMVTCYIKSTGSQLIFQQLGICVIPLFQPRLMKRGGVDQFKHQG